ncbi:MAG: hypothetical protein ONB46_18990 [candidate division KSB1 bacterium]|nr:hypothetical protein [candidate division KSB1 bacterium]MDZ7367955.1 hypothetical protein [candidate division KSB1 bacterium]MDZ7405578.1 hypothetical protein [candidate division KSB1 bacterium]
MIKIFYHLAFSLAWLVLISCAGGSAQKTRDAGNKYSAALGLASTYDFNDITRKAFDKYQFQVERYVESGDRIYLETQWKLRRLFEDEQAQGVVEAQSRIIMETRPRIRSGSETKLSTVHFTAENKVLLANSGMWVNAPMSPLCREYFKNFAEELRTTFSASMRRY